MLFCPALTDQISLFEFWLCGVRRNLVICYCQEGVDKACSEFTCDSSTPYSLPSSGPRALLNSGLLHGRSAPSTLQPRTQRWAQVFLHWPLQSPSLCVCALVICWISCLFMALFPYLSFGEFIPVIWRRKKKVQPESWELCFIWWTDGGLKSRRQDLSSKGLFHRGKGEATLSNTLAWGIPWTEEAGGLQSMGSQRVRHDWSG